MAYLRRRHHFSVSKNVCSCADCLSYTRCSPVTEHASSQMIKRFQTSRGRPVMTQLEKHLRYRQYANAAPLLPSNFDNIPIRSVKILRTPCMGLPWNFTQQLSSRPQNRNTGSKPVRDAGDEDDEREDDAEYTELSEAEDEYEDDGEYTEEEDEYEEEEQEGSIQKEARKKTDKKFVKPTFKSSEPQGRVLNEDITAETVRLVIDGEGHRIVSRKEALRYAKAQNLDLVQVDGRAKPPVCKVFNFHKEEYKQEQIQKDRKKKKIEMLRLNDIKELRFTSKTELKDVKMKVEKAKTFMDRGHRVKFVAIFKGPDDEKKRVEQEKMINDIIKMVEDVATIDQGPRIEPRQAWVMLRHLKFGGAKKKASQASKPEAVNKEVKTTFSTAGQGLPSEELWGVVQEEPQSEDQIKRAGAKNSLKHMHPQVSAIPLRSPPVDSELSQVPEFSWIPNSNEQDNLRSPSESFSKPFAQGSLRHSLGSTSRAQQPEGKPEAYGNTGKRYPQRTQDVEAVQQPEQSFGSRMAHVSQGHGQGISGLSPQKHGHGAPGLSSQDHRQGDHVSPSQGRGKRVSSEGLGQGFPSQGRGQGSPSQGHGQGLPPQGRGQATAEPSSPLLDFFSSPESQPSQGSVSGRMGKSANPSIGHPRHPSHRHVSEVDRMTSSQGHGRGVLGRGQGNQQVASEGYPARRQGEDEGTEGYLRNRPSGAQSRSQGRFSSQRSAPVNDNTETQHTPSPGRRRNIDNE